jgi:hypothetical protein
MDHCEYARAADRARHALMLANGLPVEQIATLKDLLEHA